MALLTRNALLLPRRRSLIKSLADIVSDNGLSTGLQLCIDPAVSACYDGSSQTLTDLSANAHPWMLGTTTGSEASDMGFHGTPNAGSGNEWLSNDGGDRLTLNASTPAWATAMHKASAKWTVMGIYMMADAASNQNVLFSTDISSGGGVVFMPFGSKSLGIDVLVTKNGSATVYNLSTMMGTFTSSTEANFASFSADFGSSNTAAYISNESSFSGQPSTLTSPSTGACATPTIGKDTSTLAYQSGSGGNLLGLLIWNTNLSLANMKTLQAAFKTARGFTWTNA